jgi:hypothetical protein
MVGLALLFLALVTLLPKILVWYDVGTASMTTAERAKAVNDVRGTILSAIAGLAVAFGAYVTWRRLRINEEELRATRDGQVTERFTRAVDQLGNASIDVRIGGVFALERIARNSPADQETIVAVLSAFARGHAPWPPPPGAAYPEDHPLERLPTLAYRAGDVQATVTVLGSLSPMERPEEIRLPRTDLRRARLWGLRFDGAGLGGACLRWGRLDHASLVGTRLDRADLREAWLVEADLTGADLSGADLRGADLTGAYLVGTRFTDARTDARTRWPEGIDPATLGLLESSEQPAP